MAPLHESCLSCHINYVVADDELISQHLFGHSSDDRQVFKSTLANAHPRQLYRHRTSAWVRQGKPIVRQEKHPKVSTHRGLLTKRFISIGGLAGRLARA